MRQFFAEEFDDFGEETPDSEGTVEVALSRRRQVSAMSEIDELTVDRSQLIWDEESKIGIGSTATVYEGELGRGGKVVAIKKLAPSKKKAEGLKTEVLFSRECEVVSKIDHPNLVKFLGFCFMELPHLLVTEFCVGGTCYEL